jgi:large subunit ribosomal protein L9
MKVILLTDVKGRGKEGDVIEVARGFAANFLLPRKMAVEATPGNVKQLEARMHNIRKREDAKRVEAEGLAGQISGKSLVIEAKAGDTGKLFGSITGGMVADALADQLGVDVDRRKLDLHGHIKTVGDHAISVRLYQGVDAELVLKVVPVGGATEAMSAAAAEPVETAEVVEETTEIVEVEDAEPVADEADEADESDEE